MANSNNNWDLKQVLLEKIGSLGGFVNCHAHFDRAYTISPETFPLANEHLHKKWKLVDKLKRTSSQEEYERRISFAVEKMIAQGVRIACSFIDIDEAVGLKAIKAAHNIRKRYKDKISLLFASQTLKGVLLKEAREWFEKGLPYIDIIGGLPKTDAPHQDKHIDMLLQYAKQTGKRVHMHVDQENTASEKETELLAKKAVKHGLEGRVNAVHCISLAAHPKDYRSKVYKLLTKAGVGVVTCPLAWLASKRHEELTPTHNSIAPVEEMVAAGVTVGLGVDNIADVYMPFADGDIWTETRALLEACRFYDIDNIVAIASTNGRKILGVS